MNQYQFQLGTFPKGGLLGLKGPLLDSIDLDEAYFLENFTSLNVFIADRYSLIRPFQQTHDLVFIIHYGEILFLEKALLTTNSLVAFLQVYSAHLVVFLSQLKQKFVKFGVLN